MHNLIETNALKTQKGILFKTNEDYIIIETNAQKDGYYDLAIGYAHDDWEAYVRIDITYPNGDTCGFMQGLLHGKNEMTVSVYLMEGTNKIKFRHHFKDCTEIFYVENKGLAKKLRYEISPKSDTLFADKKKAIKVFVKNYRDALIKIEADGKIDIPFKTQARDITNEYSASMADIYPDSDIVYNLGEGKHNLVYMFESGKKLCQNIEINNKTPQTKMQFINFDVEQANATLIFLPNGKKLLVDSGTKKMAEERVIPYLKNNNIKLDYYLLTHFHNDHQGLKDEILEMYGIKKPDVKRIDKLIKKDKKKRYSYLKKFGYLDSSMLRYYDEIHKIWDLGGVELTAANSRFNENGEPTKQYHYSFIKNNEHNYENSTSVSFMLKFNGFGYYHSADNYGFCQDRYMSDMIKMGRENELDCHWFYASHHFINDINAKFINTLNPVGVYVPNNMLYRRAAYSYYYKDNVEDYYFSHKRLKDTLVSVQTGSAKVSVNSSEDWYYEVLEYENL